VAEVEFRLPKLGMSILEGTIIEWLVAEGEVVTEGQPMLSIEMDKAQAELPAPVAGTVVKIAAAEGDAVDVGELLAVIDSVNGAGEA
jgi:pyruvate/2-oxoglutarate dehydrogenase complex dihydrolipoamide acyltransferase (E2) component